MMRCIPGLSQGKKAKTLYFSDHEKIIAQPVEMLLLKDQYILVLHVYI